MLRGFRPMRRPEGCAGSAAMVFLGSPKLLFGPVSAWRAGIWVVGRRTQKAETATLKVSATTENGSEMARLEHTINMLSHETEANENLIPSILFHDSVVTGHWVSSDRRADLQHAERYRPCRHPHLVVPEIATRVKGCDQAAGRPG